MALIWSEMYSHLNALWIVFDSQNFPVKNFWLPEISFSSGRWPCPTHFRVLGEHRLGLLCTYPIYVLIVAPRTWPNAKDSKFSWFSRNTAMLWDCLFFNIAPAYWGWNHNRLWWDSYVNCCSGGPSTCLIICASCHTCLVSGPCLLCVWTVLPTCLSLTEAWDSVLPLASRVLRSPIWHWLHIAWHCRHFTKVFPKYGLMLSTGPETPWILPEFKVRSKFRNSVNPKDGEIEA